MLLPRKQVPENAGIGDTVTVFIYRDSQDRLLATTRKPMLVLGQVARLEVKDTGKIGAFLDWGLERICSFRLRSRPTGCARVTAALLPYI